MRSGNLPLVQHIMEEVVTLIPGLSRVRTLRHWGGVMDMSPDGDPIIDKTPIDGLYLNAGWCYGGFKATPASGWALCASDGHRQNAFDQRTDDAEAF